MISAVPMFGHGGLAMVYGATIRDNVKALRDQEALIAEQAEKGYEQFVAAWQRHPPRDRTKPKADRSI